MGIDMYVEYESGDDPTDYCCRNIASEIPQLEEILGEGSLLDLIFYPEEGDEPEFADAAEVLEAVKEAIQAVTDGDDIYDYGKEPLLSDLVELQASVEEAVKRKAKIALSVC